VDTPVAIVTAAGRGVGAACARALARRKYAVVLMSPSGTATQLARELGGLGLQGSVAEPADLDRLVRSTLERYGRIDAVVNNTGHPPKGDLLEITDEEWRAGLDLLFLNVVRLTRLVTPVMLKQGSGTWVNISSTAAVEPSLDFPVSSAFRAALGNYMRLYCLRYSANGIRMNTVLPGYFDSYPVNDAQLAGIPLRRVGTVDEVAEAVAFLLSAEAGYITGQSLRIDGGMTRVL
jgi:NAD(P)-dependent dehydrogenase (short-subunit alcohol dehydrogenase family)